ncbi:MAG: hypothetical protein AAGE52_04020 [Myxococcota bacterium]
MRLIVFSTVLLACGGSLRSDGGEASHGLTDGIHYEIRVDATLSRMWVKTCFDGETPSVLEPMTSQAVDLLGEAYGDQGQVLPLTDDRKIDLSRLGIGECVRYDVDLEVAGWSRQAVRQGRDLMVTQALFLWRPPEWDPSIRVAIDMDLPRGMHVSTAWPRTRRGDVVMFRPDRSVIKTVGNVVFMTSPPLHVEVGTTRAEIAVLDGPLHVGRRGVERWLREALRAASTMHGRFHTDHLHIAVLPIGPGWRPVAFGMVRRGGGPSVMLLVHENADEEELVSDWTAVHELSHLGLPRMYNEDRWISEGFATYYQEVLRARAGLIPPEKAWENMAAGFARGAYSGSRGPLWRDAANFRGVGRIYWAGTAYMLDTDVRYRQRQGSLDDLVRRYLPEWTSTTDAWHGLDCTASLDRIFGSPLSQPLARNYGRMRRYPDTEALLRQLGVESGIGRSVTLNDRAPLAGIRRAITEPLEN